MTIIHEGHLPAIPVRYFIFDVLSFIMLRYNYFLKTTKKDLCNKINSCTFVSTTNKLRGVVLSNTPRLFSYLATETTRRDRLYLNQYGVSTNDLF